jgi:hypothetical protein
MSPAQPRLNFSTFDRADQSGWRYRQHLTAVPVADLATVPAGLVVIDETATLSLGRGRTTALRPGSPSR